MRKQTSFIKVWTRWQGTKSLPNMPMMRIEHYFPEIDDPKIIQLALTEFRSEWDTDAKSVEELPEFSNHCTYANDVVLKPLFNTSSRQLEEKRFFFSSQETIEMADDPVVELADGHTDDIYEWFSSIPNELRPAAKSHVRADTIFGINRYGKIANRPPKASPEMPENRGVYLSCVMQ